MITKEERKYLRDLCTKIVKRGATLIAPDDVRLSLRALDTIDALEKERDHYLEALETIASDALPGCLDRRQCARDYLDGEEEGDE